MAKKYSFHPPGYDPTQDRVPPRATGLKPLLTCLGMLFICVFVAGFGISAQVAGNNATKQTLEANTDTPTTTLDSWSETGTAVFWETYTPTGTLSPTPSETPTETVTPTETATATLDSWSGTGTALYWQTYTPTPTLDISLTLNIQATIDALPTLHPTRTRTPLPNNPPPPPVIVYRTQPPEPPIIVTQRVVVTSPPIVITVIASRIPPSATATASPTETATATETASPTVTDVPSPTFTASPTETLLPTVTDLPTEMPTEPAP